MEYNLDEIDQALSSAGHQAAPVRGPPDDRAGTRTPGTRRGSLVPVTTLLTVPGAKKKKEKNTQNELNLFTFDLRGQVKDVLLEKGESRAAYHEYAVFSPPIDDPNGATRSPRIIAEGDDALRMLRDAIQNGHGLDVKGDFGPNPKGSNLLRGRVRQVIAHRRPRYGGSVLLDTTTPGGLVLTAEDYNSLGLHSATLPSIQRVTVESHFWNAKKDTIC